MSGATPVAPGLVLSARVQARVLGALLLRELLTRYGRHNIGFLWLFVEPMLFTLGVAMLWTATRATHGSNLPIIAFAVTGYSTVLLWRNTASRCTRAIEPNLGLLFHRNVRVADIFVSRALLEIVGATISTIVLMSAFIAVGLMSPPYDLLTMLTGWLLLCWFSIGLGMTVGACSEFSEVFDRLWHTFTYLAFPLSGAIFMVEWLPSAAQDAILLVPMVHAVELIRGGYFGPTVTTHGSPGYIAVSALVVTLSGLLLSARLASRIEPE